MDSGLVLMLAGFMVWITGLVIAISIQNGFIFPVGGLIILLLVSSTMVFINMLFTAVRWW